MATVQDPQSIDVSSDAYRMLSEVSSEFSEMLLDAAAIVARERGGAGAVVEASDLVEAARILSDALESVKTKPQPDSARVALDGMISALREFTRAGE